MADLQELARKRNTLRQKVVDWMAAEGARGNLRTNSQAPDWNDYEAAERELGEAVAAAGINGATADT
jgi:hypothetical protein